MDSDVLTLRRPHEVIAWIEGGHDPILFGQPSAPMDLLQSANGKCIQTIFRENVNAVGKLLGLATEFPQGATAGFYGCGNEELSLERVEHAIKACLHLGMSMQEWGSDQCVVIYLLASAGAKRLPPDLYVNFDFDQVDSVRTAHIVHFLGFCRFYKNIYLRCATQIVQDLKREVLPFAQVHRGLTAAKAVSQI